MDKLLQDSSSQITNWATEVATLRANNAELSDALAAESSQSAEYQRDIAALKEECEAYNVDRVSAGDAIAVAEHYKAVAEANEEAFGRLSEQLSVYTQKLDGLQVCSLRCIFS